MPGHLRAAGKGEEPPDKCRDGDGANVEADDQIPSEVGSHLWGHTGEVALFARTISLEDEASNAPMQILTMPLAGHTCHTSTTHRPRHAASTRCSGLTYLTNNQRLTMPSF
jgi:hypothetical protein